MQSEMQQAKDSIKPKDAKERLLVVSVGAHTRLGDVLEFALAETPLETIDADTFMHGSWTDRRVLFAVSADATGENAQLRLLAASLRAGALEHCVCAAIADGAAGGEAHLDMIRLLRTANDAGATILAKSLLESGRELRQFVHGKETPFTQYRHLARQLVERLCVEKSEIPEHPRVRFHTALEGGAAHDWREFLSKLIESSGGELADIGEPDETILLCENTEGLPNEKTLSLLTGSGKLRVLVASPTTGIELYATCLLERACLRGSYTLPPRAFLTFDGLSAVEAMASRAEMERVKGLFAK
jgi:hypothetical protein